MLYLRVLPCFLPVSIMHRLFGPGVRYHVTGRRSCMISLWVWFDVQLHVVLSSYDFPLFLTRSTFFFRERATRLGAVSVRHITCVRLLTCFVLSVSGHELCLLGALSVFPSPRTKEGGRLLPARRLDGAMKIPRPSRGSCDGRTALFMAMSFATFPFP